MYSVFVGFQVLIAGIVEGSRRMINSLSGSNFNMKITELKFFERLETIYPATLSSYPKRLEYPVRENSNSSFCIKFANKFSDASVLLKSSLSQASSVTLISNSGQET